MTSSRAISGPSPFLRANERPTNLGLCNRVGGRQEIAAVRREQLERDRRGLGSR